MPTRQEVVQSRNRKSFEVEIEGNSWAKYKPSVVLIAKYLHIILIS